jgi:GNAT superfamily N-acetyltransferase
MTAASFTVRRMEEADRPVLLRHALAQNLFEDAISHDRATDPSDAEATLDEVLGRVAETGGLPLVAEAAGAVVGHLFLTIDHHPPYVRADRRRYGYVADAFVQEAWRGQGAFRAMLAEAEAFTRALGCRHMLIGVLHGNARAERIYLRAGFRPYAVEMIREVSPG